MAGQNFAPLGMALRNTLMMPPQAAPVPSAPAPKKFLGATLPEGMSKGQIIAGILGEVLSKVGGGQSMFLPAMMAQRQQQQEEVTWGRRRSAELEDYERKQQIEQRYRQPEVPPMLRDVQTFMGMDAAQRAAFSDLQKAKEGDPIVNTTLPNGQFYSGPRSGLAAALMGGGQAPQKPVGKLTPMAGGPTPQASGTFRRP